MQGKRDGGNIPNPPQRREQKSGDARDEKGKQPLKIFTKPPSQPASSVARQPEPQVKHNPAMPELFGTVNTIKPGFGFIQPILDEEQIYFGGRELTPDIKIGDRVGFLVRQSARGLAAENVRTLSSQMDKVVSSVKGSVSRNPDRHRSNFGMVAVELSTTDARSAALLESAGLKEIPFLPSDVTAKSIPKNHRLDKGDYVEFSVHRVIGTNLYIARNVNMLQLKRDRAISQQIQRMLDAGVKREQGVISTLKKGEYGFIKPLDRKEEIYFRMEDGKDPTSPSAGNGAGIEAAADNESDKLVEGAEVEFFVITECVKGKMSDRAIHVRSIPKGTVKFELVLASSVRAVVIAESGARPEESPGICRLDQPVSFTALQADPALLDAATAATKKGGSEDTVPSVSTIELWQRCLPEELVCRVGDVLQLDVHYYRPEKLFFARSVKVVKYRALGREKGYVCALKENGFGFIHSPVRGADAYFKSPQVLNSESLPAPESALKIGTVVSFDVICEDTNSGGKLRAKRVVMENPATAQLQAQEDAVRYTLQERVTGTVLRLSTKKDSPGLIKMHAAFVDGLKSTEFCDPDLVDALTAFQACAQLQSTLIHALPLATLKSYYHVIESRFPGIAHESSPADARDPSLGHNLKIFKLTGDKYDAWKAANTRAGGSGGVDKSRTDPSNLPFFKDDYCSPEFGALAADLKVTFSVCWDPTRARKVAKRIRLTDEPICDAAGEELGEQQGIIDVLVDKVEKYGFIRCIPSDEKLFWHMASASNGTKGGNSNGGAGKDALPLMLGSEVAFQLRRRGGLRCAAGIRTLHQGTLAEETVLPELCTALVIAPNHLVLVDVSAAPLLRKKYLDPRAVTEATAPRDSTGSATAKENWSKVALEAVTPATSSPVEIVGELECETEKVSIGDDVADLSPTAGVDVTPAETGVLSAVIAEVDPSDYKAKYFQVLPRTPLTIVSNGTAAQVGDLVRCRVTVKWVSQRSPVSAEVVDVVPTEDADGKVAAKKRGRISRMKMRVKALPAGACAAVDDECLTAYSLPSVDFVEITDLSGEEGAQLFYCEALEVLPCDEQRDGNSRDSVAFPQPGDEVDFWAVRGAGNLAFHVRMLPKVKDHGIQFAKRPVTTGSTSVQAASTAAAAKASPLNLITMAEGPPNDASTGFPVGWRAVAAASAEGGAEPTAPAAVVVSSLPWAHLLPHLM